MNYWKKLRGKYLQIKHTIKQRTHAIDLLVSGQTAANQRSIANTRNLKQLRKHVQCLESAIFSNNVDNRNKFRYVNNELLDAKRAILWLKAWIFGLTIFTIVITLWFTIKMF